MNDKSPTTEATDWKTLAAKLAKALDVLSDEADHFSVSGVYFHEPCMGHKGLDLAREALEEWELANGKG